MADDDHLGWYTVADIEEGRGCCPSVELKSDFRNGAKFTLRRLVKDLSSSDKNFWYLGNRQI